MKGAVILFTRVPKPGATKTRLLPVLDPDQCAGLHRAFLRDLARIYDSLEADLFIAHTPDPDWEALKAIFPHGSFFPQQGSDLGEKMYHAIREVLEQGYDAVVLTGSDLPLMTAEHLERGFALLAEKDIAIGPTSDGGYYLIGMGKPCPEVFRVEGYGGASVFGRTVAAAEGAGLSVGVGLPCDDVDTPEDLRRLAVEADPDSHTGRYLEILKKEGVAL